MLKKILNFFSGKEKNVSLEFGVNVHLRMNTTPTVPSVPSSPPLPPTSSKKEVIKEVAYEKAMSIPLGDDIEVDVIDLRRLTEREEIFLINMSKYQADHLRKQGLNPRTNLCIYLSGSEIVLTYRSDTTKWEVFYNPNVWSTKLTTYLVPSDILKYKVDGFAARRFTCSENSLKDCLVFLEKHFTAKDKIISTKTQIVDFTKFREVCSA